MSLILSLIALAIVANFALIYWQNSRPPKLGVKAGRLAQLSPKPNNVSSQSDDPAKQVAPLPAKASPEATLAALKQAAHQYGGATLISEQPDYLYFVFTTSLMRFKDDVEFWLNPESGQVEVRSSSRAGYSDMGLNRKRYDALAELYQAA